MRVSQAEFIADVQSLSDRAVCEPVTVTEDGRDKLVVISAEEHARLRRADRRDGGRRVFAAGELTDEQIEAIRTAEVPAEHAYSDDELRE